MEEDDCKVTAKASTKLIIKDGRKPAEIFRTDLITAMKIPDHQIIPSCSYFGLTDPWKQEWERGVQVPVNMASLPQPSFQLSESNLYPSSDFKMPPKLVNVEIKKEKRVSYDLDDEDVEWLKALNRSRINKGLEVVEEFLLEKAITCLENQCYTNLGETISTEKGLSIEYDEDISCDVCRVPDSEDGNEIVFCDICDVAVHQACYGVQKVPVGSWVCRPCAQLQTNSPCLLCPNGGGAMKRTKSKGFKGWIHMSCALWVPEVGIGDVEKMEPITRIETITPGRWNLLCYICKERKGACIQCSVKTCVTAFHVTCGFNNNLEMQTVLDDAAPDGVRHVCYCYKHGPKRGNKSPRKSPRKSLTGTTNKQKATRRPSCTSPLKSAVRNEVEQENIRQRKLRGMEEEFYIFVDPKYLATELHINTDLAKTFHHFWTLKRKSRDDASLLPPTAEQQECLAGRQVKPYQRATMEIERVVRLRQDLERIRNLCYMVEKREKQKRDLTKARETVFWKELEIMADTSGKMKSEDMQWARSCCTNNFTEYETLQSLNFNYFGKMLKRRRGRPRKSNVMTSSSEEEDDSSSRIGEGENSITGEEEGSTSRIGEHCLKENRVRSKENIEFENGIIPSADDIGGTVSPRKLFEATVETGGSKDDHSGEGVSGETCCGSARQTTKRLRDMSSDTDFEDDSNRKSKRRPSIRRRLMRSPKQKKKNGVISDTASSSSGHSTDQLNGLHQEIRKNGRLRLVKNKDVNSSSDIDLPFCGSMVGRNFKRNSNTVLGEFSRKIDDSGLEMLPCRLLRSNGAFLDGKMMLDKCDIPQSSKRLCVSNGVALSPKRDGHVIQNGTSLKIGKHVSDANTQNQGKQVFGTRTRFQEKQVSDETRLIHDKHEGDLRNPGKTISEHESISEVCYRTRSRSSSGEPGSPLTSHTAGGVFSKRSSANRKSVSDFQSRGSLGECFIEKCRTRQSPDKLRESLETSFSNSTGCEFFSKFRPTATTSA